VDVVIVYESMFGNTRSIAESIADGVRTGRPQATVSVLSVAEAVPEEIRKAALVVVGGPTHMRGMSTLSSRRR
jgi:flavorubredoxin